MNMIDDLRTITGLDFAELGIHSLAYIKPVRMQALTVYSVHTADGAQVASFFNRNAAVEAIREYDLEPFSVH